MQRPVSFLLLLLSLALLFHRADGDPIVPEPDRFPHYRLEQVDAANVVFHDTIWAPRQETVRTKTIDWMTRHYDRGGGFAAYRKDPSSYQARPGGSEAIKTIEAAAEMIRLSNVPQLGDYMHAWIDVYRQRQSEDGYLYNPVVVERFGKWGRLQHSHELYTHGHYLESAIAMFRADGTKTMLDSARRAMILIDDTFGPGKKIDVPGHPEIEIALMRYYALTGEKRWSDLCRFFIEQRGRHEHRRSYGEYAQDHLPVERQRTMRGHAVRASFLYAGLTDLHAATGDGRWLETSRALWNDMAGKHQYVTGAVGIYKTGIEGFGEPYRIPPDDAYGESCEGFANILWASRLHRIEPDGKYFDNIETILYNNMLNSLSPEGDRFYYRNHLQTDCPDPRSEWDPCPCCPPNISKLFAHVGQYFYSTDETGIWCNLYADSDAEIPFPGGTVSIRQRGGYPWRPTLRFEIDAKTDTPTEIRFRMPEGKRPLKLTLNGCHFDVVSDIKNGYLAISRQWGSNDVVEMTLPLEFERVSMPEPFVDYHGLVAFKRGPIVYCAEQEDTGENLFAVVIPPETTWREEYRPDWLGGCVVQHGRAKRVRRDILDAVSFEEVPITMIPYHLQSLRTPGEMRIWFAENERSLPPRRILISRNPKGPGTTALCDGEFGPERALHFAWWPSKGTREWVQYDFPVPKTFSETTVAWFDDIERGGGCKVPKTWNVFYRNGRGEWTPVSGIESPTPERDKPSRLEFPPITTNSVRLEAELHDGFSAGMFEWDVR